MVPLVGILFGLGLGGAALWALTAKAPDPPGTDGPLPYDRSMDGLPPDTCTVGATRIVLADAYSPPVIGTVYQCLSAGEACVRDSAGRTECGDLQ